jgi:hypothetical protein
LNPTNHLVRGDTRRKQSLGIACTSGACLYSKLRTRDTVRIGRRPGS